MTIATPEKPTVVFDGSCPYCQRQVRRMQARDVQGIFDYLPRQVDDLDQRFPQLAHGDFNTGMRLVRTDGSVAVGADAVYEIARQLKGWKNLAWLYRVPGLQQVFRAAYAWIAANRYRLAQKSGQTCDDGECKI